MGEQPCLCRTWSETTKIGHNLFSVAYLQKPTLYEASALHLIFCVGIYRHEPISLFYHSKCFYDDTCTLIKLGSRYANGTLFVSSTGDYN